MNQNGFETSSLPRCYKINRSIFNYYNRKCSLNYFFFFKSEIHMKKIDQDNYYITNLENLLKLYQI